MESAWDRASRCDKTRDSPVRRGDRSLRDEQAMVRTCATRTEVRATTGWLARLLDQLPDKRSKHLVWIWSDRWLAAPYAILLSNQPLRCRAGRRRLKAASRKDTGGPAPPPALVAISVTVRASPFAPCVHLSERKCRTHHRARQSVVAHVEADKGRRHVLGDV